MTCWVCSGWLTTEGQSSTKVTCASQLFARAVLVDIRSIVFLISGSKLISYILIVPNNSAKSGKANSDVPLLNLHIVKTTFFLESIFLERIELSAR